MRPRAVTTTSLFRGFQQRITKRGFAVPIKDLAGSMTAFYHLSPLTGAIFNLTKGTNDCLDIAKTEQVRSPTSQVANALFYRHGEQFRATRNKSLPGYSLTPEILAKILGHLHANTLDTPATFEEISVLWKKTHYDLTGDALGDKNIKRLIKWILKSKAECIKQKISPYLTENILLGFLCLRSTTRSEIDEFINTLPEHLKKSATKNSDREYENSIYSLIKYNHQLPCALMDYYCYNHNMSFPSCVETAYHNICNALLFDQNTGKFSFSLLPEDVHPHADLFRFYETQEFETADVCSAKTGQTFMDMISGKSHLFKYSRKDHELSGTIDNFLPVMNYLFGTNADSFQSLSEILSSKERQVIFKAEYSEEKQEDIVRITMRTHEIEYEMNMVCAHNGHAEIRSNIFDKNTGNLKALSLQEQAIEQFEKDPLFYRLVTHSIPDDMANQHFLQSTARLFYSYGKNRKPSPENLASFLQFHPVKTQEEAYWLSVKIIDLLQDNQIPSTLSNQIKKYLSLLVKKFPRIIFMATENSSPFKEHTRIAGGVESFISQLLKAGLDLKAADESGKTLLHYAVDQNNETAASLLLKAGASVLTKDTAGHTPLDIAMKCRKNSAIILQLLQHAENGQLIEENNAVSNKHSF